MHPWNYQQLHSMCGLHGVKITLNASHQTSAFGCFPPQFFRWNGAHMVLVRALNKTNSLRTFDKPHKTQKQPPHDSSCAAHNRIRLRIHCRYVDGFDTGNKSCVFPTEFVDILSTPPWTLKKQQFVQENRFCSDGQCQGPCWLSGGSNIQAHGFQLLQLTHSPLADISFLVV